MNIFVPITNFQNLVIDTQACVLALPVLSSFFPFSRKVPNYKMNRWQWFAAGTEWITTGLSGHMKETVKTI